MNGKRIGGRRGPQKRGPLRTIMHYYSHATDIFGKDSAVLECGHEVRCTPGVNRARCNHCHDGKEPDPVMMAAAAVRRESIDWVARTGVSTANCHKFRIWKDAPAEAGVKMKYSLCEFCGQVAFAWANMPDPAKGFDHCSMMCNRELWKRFSGKAD